MLRVRVAVVLLLSVCLLPPVTAGQTTTYRILVINDDGVRAPGLAAVAQILQAIGDVTIVAPADNQSGRGHAITIAEPMFRQEVTLPNGLRAIGVTATPASTMKVALHAIVKPPPDLVVSGINRGYNLGLSAYVSGTVGAAREAAMAGIPAIAASTTGTVGDYGFAAEEVLGVARRVKQYGLPRHSFLNVNIPSPRPEPYKGYLVTAQAMTPGGDERFVEDTHPSGRTFYWNLFTEGGTAPEGTDVWAVANGYVSVTPMQVGEEAAAVREALRGWFK